MIAPPVKVVLFGECMLELRGPESAMQLGFGGDTLNTAVYLARLGGPSLAVHYATALGDDPHSARMAAAWVAEGIALDLVHRVPGALPGLYMVSVDGRGERSFSYWRDQAAARRYFDVDTTPLEDRAVAPDVLYVSGISLAILPEAGRERLFALMARLRAQGRQVVFDNNFRPRLWGDVQTARRCYDRAFELASTALVTADDHQQLHGLATLAEAVASAQALGCGEVLVKRGAAATLVRDRKDGAGWTAVATEPVAQVVDTTAAGDAFAAGYLARRLAGASAVEAARFGNRVAARVIQHPGALIAAEHLRDLVD